jgi:hypothetical protein
MGLVVLVAVALVQGEVDRTGPRPVALPRLTRPPAVATTRRAMSRLRLVRPRAVQAQPELAVRVPAARTPTHPATAVQLRRLSVAISAAAPLAAELAAFRHHRLRRAAAVRAVPAAEARAGLQRRAPRVPAPLVRRVRAVRGPVRRVPPAGRTPRLAEPARLPALPAAPELAVLGPAVRRVLAARTTPRPPAVTVVARPLVAVRQRVAPAAQPTPMVARRAPAALALRLRAEPRRAGLRVRAVRRRVVELAVEPVVLAARLRAVPRLVAPAEPALRALTEVRVLTPLRVARPPVALGREARPPLPMALRRAVRRAVVRVERRRRRAVLRRTASARRRRRVEQVRPVVMAEAALLLSATPRPATVALAGRVVPAQSAQQVDLVVLVASATAPSAAPAAVVVVTRRR